MTTPGRRPGPTRLRRRRRVLPDVAAGLGAAHRLECAERVHYSPWEPRPENFTANRRTPTWPVSVRTHPDFNSTYQAKFRPRINGDFTGTTDEIIQWASCKWGISDEDASAPRPSTRATGA